MLKCHAFLSVDLLAVGSLLVPSNADLHPRQWNPPVVHNSDSIRNELFDFQIAATLTGSRRL